MRIVVSDSSCLIDLHKGGILESVFGLPFHFAIPKPLFDEELLSIPEETKTAMIDLGLEVMSLPGRSVEQASQYFNEHRRLKLNDCFALVIAETTTESILFTGDAPLKKLAQSLDIEAHGVIWAIDQMTLHKCVDADTVLRAIEIYLADPLVFLPQNELLTRRKRHSR